MATPQTRIAFIGGGNMAGAIIGGLLRQGLAPGQIEVVEPVEAARARLREQFQVLAQPEAGSALAGAGLVVWAVKPQTFKDAASQARPLSYSASTTAPLSPGMSRFTV